MNIWQLQLNEHVTEIKLLRCHEWFTIFFMVLLELLINGISNSYCSMMLLILLR